MKNGVISARLDAPYVLMIDRLRLPGERDGELIRRALDALALSDEDFLLLMQKDEAESQQEKYIYD